MTLNPLNLFDRDGIEAHLRAGGAALLPTDTLPALASMPEQAAQIWQLEKKATGQAVDPDGCRR
jgi:L-threonylcarbamoyladenylate synthase